MIEVRALTHDFDGVVAVDDASFQVAEGDVFGFIGPNGAGKTTTIRVLATLLKPTAGDAFIDGVSVSEDPQRVRGLIGYMPDVFGVYENITVREYLEFFAGAYDIPRHQRRATIGGVMELCDLLSLEHRMVANLSKGMKQRLCLAKVLVHDPKVLILDEPASGLDPRARIELRALVQELREMGKTILVSSHILSELGDICNTVGIIEQGRMLACGPMRDMAARLDAGRGDQVVRLRIIGACEVAETLLTQHPAVVAVSRRGEEIQVACTGDERTVSQMVRLLVEGGVEVCEVVRETADLESIFLHLTQGRVS